ncbi:hypothetical protein GH714_038184 [Hevea brasiliensis]|uniref:Kazal-like domain-containing protein n=1 Tax=Hevea brasiliensis TaxID=3981 RepID=A0A6A6MS40_HEVBR|nr:hypothetical protein GH714_038184 [Hevea brasiliensis]
MVEAGDVKAVFTGHDHLNDFCGELTGINFVMLGAWIPCLWEGWMVKEGQGGGATPAPEECPIACFRPDPVCGANGVTYWCGCPDALCAGVPVVKFGEC